MFNQSDEVDSLHIPHIGFLQWFCTNKNIDASMQDKKLRKIGIRFYLEDLRAGTSWTYLELENEQSQTIKGNNGEIITWFEKNKEGYLRSILVELNATGCIEAFKETSVFIFSILSTLCFFYRRPLKVSTIKIMDAKYHVELQTRKYAAKAIKMNKPLASFQASPIGSLFSIYRDGMNSVKLPYRYICFFKIYEAWLKRAEKFFDRKASDKQRIVITKNLLAGSYRGAFHQAFLNKHFDDTYVYENLNYVRNCLVHPVVDHRIPPNYCNFDKIEHIEAIEAMSNLIERMATKILDVELKLVAKTDLDIKKLLDIYKIDV